MLREHDRIVLTTELPDQPLERGDVGTVVHISGAGQACEAPFGTLEGRPAAVLTLKAAQLRQVGAWEITHARELAKT